MNKEIKLTIRLKEKGVRTHRRSGNRLLDVPGRRYIQGTIVISEDEIYRWTIESCLSWLREKGYGYEIQFNPGHESYTTVWRKKPFYEHVIEIKPGSELEGLLEGMVKIMEGEK